MTHPLETEYGLTADELLDAMNRRFRAKVTLEGAVAEVQLGKKLGGLVANGIIERFEMHDQDGMHDATVVLGRRSGELRVECKNIRNSDEAYRERGQVVAYKVEVQKTRTSNGDPSTRYYGADQFDVLAVCLGKKTHDWTKFMFVKTADLKRHGSHSAKLAVMHRVPLATAADISPWFLTFEELLRTL